MIQLPDRDSDGQQAVPERAVQIPGAHPSAGVHGGRGHAARGRGGDGRRRRPQVSLHHTAFLLLGPRVLSDGWTEEKQKSDLIGVQTEVGTFYTSDSAIKTHYLTKVSAWGEML